MTISAKFENGVFKPLQDVHISEGTVVEVHVPPTKKAVHQSIRKLGFAGMWAYRDEIEDGVSYVNQLRKTFGKPRDGRDVPQVFKARSSPVSTTSVCTVGAYSMRRTIVGTMKASATCGVGRSADPLVNTRGSVSNSGSPSALNSMHEAPRHPRTRRNRHDRGGVSSDFGLRLARPQ